ncbi:hypothetical protein [Moraxella lacunata]|uniref:hypothetical protein n=1 Tax=Moraxella lacunata TaxID=477 RepID=UPI003EDF7CF0
MNVRRKLTFLTAFLWMMSVMSCLSKWADKSVWGMGGDVLGLKIFYTLQNEKVLRFPFVVSLSNHDGK